MKHVIILLFVVVTSFAYGSALAETKQPVLEPQSAETPDCHQKCMTSCRTHCRLGCVYNCRCPKEQQLNNSCRADCVEPCAKTCQTKECRADVCDKQCKV